ncbi:MAG: hypothetical protein ACPLRY_03450 [Candidatus Bathyarchaeales archaeon]
MGEGKRRHSERVDLLGLVSFGFFLILVGILWIETPNLTDAVIAFFKDFQLVHLTEHIILPAPVNNHSVVYTAAMQFCLTFGVFQTVILVLRFFFHDSLKRKAETFSSIAFWFTISFFWQMLANANIGWLGFIGGFIISIGVTITARSLFSLLG